MDDDTQELTEAAIRGDRQAVDALVERYLPQLRAFVRLRANAHLRGQERNSDVVQSVCREVLENASDFRHGGETAFKRWLFTTALRKLGKLGRYHRAEKRDVRKREELGFQADARVADIYRSFSTPSQHAEVREQMERVEAAFDELSEDQREVVTLAHLVGMSRAEIATQVGKTDAAVRVTLHRALAKLSKLLAE